MIRRFIPLFCLTLLLLLSCGEKRDRDAIKKKTEVIIKRDSPALLLKTIGDIIRYGRSDLLNTLYTTKSLKAIQYNQESGIGSAGTIDGFLREEIVLWQARSGSDPLRKPDNGKKQRQPFRKREEKIEAKQQRAKNRPGKAPVFIFPKVLQVREALYLIQWPSGTRFPILFVKKGKKWSIDVLRGPGGKILLLRK